MIVEIATLLVLLLLWLYFVDSTHLEQGPTYSPGRPGIIFSGSDRTSTVGIYQRSSNVQRDCTSSPGYRYILSSGSNRMSSVGINQRSLYMQRDHTSSRGYQGNISNGSNRMSSVGINQRRKMALHEIVNDCHMGGIWSHRSTEAPRVRKLLWYSDEYERVASKVTATLDVEIDRIEKIYNPFLLGHFLLMEEEYKSKFHGSTRRELFHCTDPQNIKSIITNNFDWRRASRVKFGRGVSFSPSASYANLQAGDKNLSDSRALILAKVLVGRACKGNEYMIIPPEGYDTSIGRGGNVLVKYRDHEFYPQYVIYYETPRIIFTSYGRRYKGQSDQQIL